MTSPSPSSTVDVLFRPFRIKSLEIPNRIVMAPMTRSFSPRGVPGPEVAAYYARRAENSVGLILSEGVAIDRPEAKNDPNVPHFYGDEALRGWARVIDSVHAVGGKMGPQLWHVGAVPGIRPAWSLPWPDDWAPSDERIDSPSGLAAPGVPRGAAMSDAAIADTIDAYATAAAHAQRMGFDTVEFHAAHGYLIDQFFWGETNRREDGFGGSSLGLRTRFAQALLQATRAAVGEDFPIILRISQWKLQDFAARNATTPKELEEWLTPLVAAGADIIHCSQRRFWEAEFPEQDGEQGLNLAGWVKKVTGAPTISVGSVGLSSEMMTAFQGDSSQVTPLDDLIERMERDEFDLIALGRVLLTDPQWVRKVRGDVAEPLLAFNPARLDQLE